MSDLLPRPDPNQRRIIQLANWGYVVLDPKAGRWYLTEKGWRCLSACAEPPIEKSRHRTISELDSELATYAIMTGQAHAIRLQSNHRASLVRGQRSGR
jgi:hypothetical protein